MRALSIRQPWAYLIVKGFKDIENRSWKGIPVGILGPVLIHAGQKQDLEFVGGIDNRGYPIPASLPVGGIVGQAEIVDVVRASTSRWFTGPIGFVLASAKTLPFFPCQGQLGFFNINYPEQT